MKRHPGRPKKENKEACKSPGCIKEASVKGFCHTHYVYLRRGDIDDTGARLREPGRVARYAEGQICLVKDCGGKPRSRGMCNKHMLQRQAGIIDEHGNQLRELLPTGRKRERESWIGSTRDGYVLRVAPQGHPTPRADGTILEHRLVMESLLGRVLHDWEIVHHKDGDRQNNIPENLELMDGRSRHGVGHPPGSDLDVGSAIQVLLQQSTLPDGLRQWLEWYRVNRFAKSETELLIYQTRAVDLLKDQALSS